MGFRGRRQEVEGWGDGVIVSESMQIHCPHENGRASNFSTLRPVVKKVCFQDPCGRSAKTMQYMCVFVKSVLVWMAPDKMNENLLIWQTRSLAQVSSITRLPGRPNPPPTSNPLQNLLSNTNRGRHSVCHGNF